MSTNHALKLKGLIVARQASSGGFTGLEVSAAGFTRVDSQHPPKSGPDRLPQMSLPSSYLVATKFTVRSNLCQGPDCQQNRTSWRS